MSLILLRKPIIYLFRIEIEPPTISNYNKLLGI